MVQTDQSAGPICQDITLSLLLFATDPENIGEPTEIKRLFILL
jgi:hypothetical protein